MLLLGLMSLSSKVNGGRWKVEQFPPGHFAEYQLNKDGSASLLREKQYYTIGTAPLFKTLVPYSGIIHFILILYVAYNGFL